MELSIARIWNSMINQCFLKRPKLKNKQMNYPLSKLQLQKPLILNFQDQKSTLEKLTSACKNEMLNYLYLIFKIILIKLDLKSLLHLWVFFFRFFLFWGQFWGLFILLCSHSLLCICLTLFIFLFILFGSNWWFFIAFYYVWGSFFGLRDKCFLGFSGRLLGKLLINFIKLFFLLSFFVFLRNLWDPSRFLGDFG